MWMITRQVERYRVQGERERCIKMSTYDQDTSRSVWRLAHNSGTLGSRHWYQRSNHLSWRRRRISIDPAIIQVSRVLCFPLQVALQKSPQESWMQQVIHTESQMGFRSSPMAVGRGKRERERVNESMSMKAQAEEEE